MFTKENVISSRFINEEHTTIEVVHTIEDDEKAHAFILEYDKDSQDFQALEKAGWDLERVTEETVGYKREASRIHNESIQAAAMEWLKENPPDVIIETIQEIENIKVVDIVNSILELNEDEDTIEDVVEPFLISDIVKNSKETNIKQEIRKAKTLIDVIVNLKKFMK